MARATLSKEEVGFIKNMISKSLPNREIAGMINNARGAVDNHISPARITDIKQGRIKTYKDIVAAPDNETVKFIEKYKNLNGEPSIESGPFNSQTLDAILPLTKDKTHFAIKETEQIECKLGLNIPLKTLAAMANNKGGYIVLGVENNSWKINGLPEEKIKKFDFRNWNQQIRQYFNVSISLQLKKRLYGNKALLLIYVSEALIKPVISTKNNDDLKEGFIYYRYPGEDKPITSSDLQRLIEERFQQLSQNILTKHISNILKIGPSNAAVLDLKSGTLEGQSGSLVIDGETLQKINFIKEGQFVERGGSPTLRLIGEVKKMDGLIVGGEKITEQYPIPIQDLICRVKKEIPDTNQNKIYALIKQYKIRDNPEYAAYPYRNEEERIKHQDKGIKPKATAIYNLKAVDFLIGLLDTSK